MLKRTLDPDCLSDRLTLLAMQRKRPLHATLELTYRCNFHCRMCYVRMTDRQAEPYGRMRTVEEWLAMARQLRDAGVLYLNLTGGECTRYPGFTTLYPALCRMGFFVSLMSNAGDYSPEVRDVFRAFPPYNVGITLYGASDETYQAVTGDPKGFTKVLDNIRFFQSLGVPVRLNFTMIRQNVLDYPRIGRICAELKLPYTILNDITPHNRDISFSDTLSCRLSPAQQVCIACHQPDKVETALKEAEILEKELADFVPPTADPPTKDDPSGQPDLCIGSQTSCAILWNGDMQTCISLAGAPGYKPFEVGFETAWQQLLAERSERFRTPCVCRNCPLEPDCPQHCAGRNFEGTKDCHTPDPDICRYAFLMHRYRERFHPETVLSSPSCVE